MSGASDVPFAEVWFLDFEFTAPPGDLPIPICMVAREWRSGRTIRLAGPALTHRSAPPFEVGPNALFVAYYASAEISCFLALGWQVPRSVIDLYVEFRCRTNGLDLPCGRGLLGALAAFGLPAIDAAEKEDMRKLAMRGSPYSDREYAALLTYCETDVVALAALFDKMIAEIDLPRAILRGRYMIAAAHIEREGVPIDGTTFSRIVVGWDNLKLDLIKDVDAEYGVYEGERFRAERWERYLIAQGIPWPRLASGRLALDDDSFREMERAYPAVSSMRQLRHALSELRLNALEVGRDGRNRTLLSAFGARSSRNTPSNTKFIFGPAVWLRSLILAPPGHAIAYVDWEQQEFGIAAALSCDHAMMAAYGTGDPYLAFGKQAGRIPPNGTKQSHGRERDLFKGVALAVQYGMEAESLARRLVVPIFQARELLQLHRSTYRRFWAWSDGAVDHAMLHGSLTTVFGWRVKGGMNPNPRSLRNFLMQANGAEMLRLACCYATERGVAICAPVHDAVLLVAPATEIESAVANMQAAMVEASRIVLNGFELRSEVKIFRHPERYSDPRGVQMWSRVMSLLENPPGEAISPTVASMHPFGA